MCHPLGVGNKMKYIITVIILIAFTQSMNAQWTIGISFSPNTSIPKTSTDALSPKGTADYSVGIVGSCQLSNSLMLRPSILYLNRKVEWANDIPDTRSATTSTGLTNFGDISRSTNSINMTWTESYQALFFPVSLDYRILSSQSFSLFLGIGAGVGLIIKRTNDLVSSGGGSYTWYDKPNQVLGSFYLELYAQKPITDFLLLTITPQYGYEMFPQENTHALQLHSFSLEIGVNILFN
jgi:hypothetical protein